MLGGDLVEVLQQSHSAVALGHAECDIADETALRRVFEQHRTEMVINAHTRTIPLMVILAATAIFGTVAVARFVTKTEGSPWRKDVP